LRADRRVDRRDVHHSSPRSRALRDLRERPEAREVGTARSGIHSTAGRSSMIVILSAFLALSVASGAAAPAAASGPTDSGWPRSFQSGSDTITAYQPQLDSWDGNRLEAHMAVSIRSDRSDEPVFGVATFAARTDVDKGSRLVHLADMTFPKIHFPSAPEKAVAFRQAIEAKSASQPQVIALDRLEAELQILRAEHK